MAGNVFEWCWDWFGTPYTGGSDPRGPASPTGYGYRVLRGGSWNDYAYVARCANRYYGINSDAGAYSFIGFRCVRGL
jgi:formylglycine-generating enzyme required for sulfatase activity